MSATPEKEYRGGTFPLWPNLVLGVAVVLGVALLYGFIASFLGHPQETSHIVHEFGLVLVTVVLTELAMQHVQKSAWVRLTDQALVLPDWRGRPRELDWAGIEEMKVSRQVGFAVSLMSGPRSLQGTQNVSFRWRGKRVSLQPSRGGYSDELVEDILRRTLLVPTGTLRGGLVTVYRRAT